MKKFVSLFIIFFSLINSNLNAKENKMILKLKYGEVEIELFPDKAPNHVKRFQELASKGEYDGVVFHRVIDGFMAQTGDVKFGNVFLGFSPEMVGRGGSDLDDLKSEFSDIPFDRGIVGMARAQNPNSANSQFFIMLADGHFLNGNYTVFGKVISGMDVVDKIKKGDPDKNGMIEKDPDYMREVLIKNK